ncbi:MAG: hypothetical protein WEE89_22360 [Gemmatimonadota bacterium]
MDKVSLAVTPSRHHAITPSRHHAITTITTITTITMITSAPVRLGLPL